MRLYTRLVLMISILLVVTTIALSYALIRSTTNDIVTTSRRDVEAIAQLLAYASAFAGDVSQQIEDEIGNHLVAEAQLAAQLVSVAEGRAGMSPTEINAILSEIASQSQVDEFQITDERGQAYLTSTGRDFTFSANPLQQPQMYVFWWLLQGQETVIQEARPREGDGTFYKYVGVSGVDQPRIVQVGQEATFLQGLARNVVIQGLVDSLTGQGDITFIRVINDDNTTLVTSSQPVASGARELTETDWQLIGQARQAQVPQSVIADNTLIAASPIVTADGESHGAVFVYQATERIQASVRAAVWRGLGLTVLALLGGLLASVGLARAVVLPVQQLGQAAQSLAHGNWEQEIRRSTIGEIDELAQAFRLMAGQLKESYAALETKVSERTAELARRVEQLALINRVGQNAAALLELQTLLPHLTSLIRDAFDYYAVLILLADAEQKDLTLKAAATTEAVDLLQDGLTLSLNGGGIIGYAATTKTPQVSNDVQSDARYLVEARLPYTRSELALPLRIGERVLGVLDLESTHPNAFSPDDVQVFHTLADQIAIAIQNAELFQTAEAARAEAEEANRAKSTFLANMSHELRTPLNSIINFTGFVLDEFFGPVTTEQRKHLALALQSSEHLLGLINDILDMAKIEAGRMELFYEEVDLGEMIKGTLATTTGLLRQKPIELRQEITPDLPILYIDRTRIRQVLLNLLSNAAKFTDRGHITVRVWADRQWVTVSIQDTGVGIPAESIPKVFAEFEQVAGEHSRRAGGTGLGMPISKRFVEMHGGRMWVESQPGEGSTFFFTLPTPATQRGPQNGAEAPMARVLVIDNDPSTHAVIAQQLADGCLILTLNETRPFLDEVREARPDVVVLDLLMPSERGWQVLRALRNDPATRDIPVVGYSLLQEKGVVMPVGAGGYLIKPVDHEDLRRVVASLAPEGGQVLVVDDDPNARDVIRHILEGTQYQVTTAPDGAAGLAAIQRQRPDVLILDLMMPGMSGFEVLGELRSNPQTASLPVVVVTAKDLTVAERSQLQAQADALFQKGQFNPEEFIALISRTLPQPQPPAEHE